jgi:hypothetical protein
MLRSVNKTYRNWCKTNMEHQKIIDTFATYHVCIELLEASKVLLPPWLDPKALLHGGLDLLGLFPRVHIYQW